MKKDRNLIKLSSLMVFVLAIFAFIDFDNRLVEAYNSTAYPPSIISSSQTPQDVLVKIYLPAVLMMAPPNTVSHYISTVNSSIMYNMGCNQGGNASTNDYVILDFGSPWIDQSSNPIKYGTELMDYQSYVYISDIEAAVHSYLSGYYLCSPSFAHVTLAVGTTNSGFSSYITMQHGQAWAEMINRIESWIKTPPTFEAKMTAVGGIDIEPMWNSYYTTISWVNGYDSVNTRPYYNFGTCDSCPYRGHPDWSPEGFGWSLENIYYVSYGAPPAGITPEIYSKDGDPLYGIHAYQWQNLKLIYPSMFFSGTLTQYDACHDPSNVNGEECIINHLDNSPGEGWILFFSALNSNPISSQLIPPWSTDFSWRINN